MPEIEEKASEFSKMATQLQRALNRSRVNNAPPLDSMYSTLDENIDAIMDWFAAETHVLPSIFKKYLTDAIA